MEPRSSDPVRRALDEGAERSSAASRPDGAPPHPPPAVVAPAASTAPTEPDSRRLELWRRHKWKIYGLLFLLLTELCILMLGKTLALGPG